LRKKLVCLHSLALCAYEISRKTRIHEFAFNNKTLKTHSSNFKSVENVRSSNVVEFEFELRHIFIVRFSSWSVSMSIQKNMDIFLGQIFRIGTVRYAEGL